MADLSPLLGEERKSDFGAVRSVDDPIRTSAGQAEVVRPSALAGSLAGSARLRSVWPFFAGSARQDMRNGAAHYLPIR